MPERPTHGGYPTVEPPPAPELSGMDVLAHCQAENARLRELYENAVGNRERFGWTINHLLECEESLRVSEEQCAGAVEAIREHKRALEERFAETHGDPNDADLALWATLNRLGGSRS